MEERALGLRTVVQVTAGTTSARHRTGRPGCDSRSRRGHPSESASPRAAIPDRRRRGEANPRERLSGVIPSPRPFGPIPSGQARGAKAGSTKSRGSRTSDGGFSEPLAPGPKWWERIFFGRVSSGQLAQFCRQFAAYLNAGVNYNKTFSSLEKQFAMTALGPALSRMRQSIKAGSTLEEAMSREKQIFSTMFLSMIRVAEARGGVPETLRMMGNHYEARQRLIRQARSAMIYPAIVLIIAGGVVALITIFLLPMFAAMLQDHQPRSPASLGQPRSARVQRLHPPARLVALAAAHDRNPVPAHPAVQDVRGEGHDGPVDPVHARVRAALPQA